MAFEQLMAESMKKKDKKKEKEKEKEKEGGRSPFFKASNASASSDTKQ